MRKTAADHELLLICSTPHLVFEAGGAACGSGCNYVKRNALKKKKSQVIWQLGLLFGASDLAVWSKYMAEEVN